MFGYLRLYEYNAAIRVKARGNVCSGGIDDLLLHFSGIILIVIAW
jgi:hypothetical protein